MLENDQILVINGTPLDQSVTQQQAITLLQQPGDRVELVVARNPSTATQHTPLLPPGPIIQNVSSKHVFMHLSKKMSSYFDICSTDHCHVMVLQWILALSNACIKGNVLSLF